MASSTHVLHVTLCMETTTTTPMLHRMITEEWSHNAVGKRPTTGGLHNPMILHYILQTEERHHIIGYLIITFHFPVISQLLCLSNTGPSRVNTVEPQHVPDP